MIRTPGGSRLCRGPLSVPRNEPVKAVLAMARILCSDPGRRGKGLSALAETTHRHQNRVGAPLYTQQPTSREGTVQAQSYDAIVVGSGISGGWAAKELTEK